MFISIFDEIQVISLRCLFCTYKVSIPTTNHTHRNGHHSCLTAKKFVIYSSSKLNVRWQPTQTVNIILFRLQLCLSQRFIDKYYMFQKKSHIKHLPKRFWKPVHWTDVVWYNSLSYAVPTDFVWPNLQRPWELDVPNKFSKIKNQNNRIPLTQYMTYTTHR